MCAQPNTVFIHPCDTYLGKSLGAAFRARGCEVLGAHHGDVPPAYLSASYKIGSPSEVSTRKQFLALASVVVYELHNYASAVRDAAVQLTSQPFGGRQQVFIGVSTPLVWAATRPPPPKEDLLEDQEEEEEAASDDENGSCAPPESVANSRPPSGRPPSGSVSARNVARMPPGSPMLGMTGTGTLGLGSSQQLQPQPPDAYTIAAALGALTDKDAARRAPGLTARDTHEVEQLLIRSQRRGRLRTMVVCPGLLYGQGEEDSLLHPVFRTAWEITAGPAVVYGPGTNKLPMVHVDDLAAYIAAASSEEARSALPEALQYLLVTDTATPGHPGTTEQRAMVTAIAQRLGTGEVKTIPSEELLFSAGGRHAELFTLDAPMATTPLAPAAGFAPKYSQGFLAHLDEVVSQWLTVRNVRPLRVLLAGPPMSGKSLAAARLAELYHLRCISARDLLAAKSLLPHDMVKVFEAEMSGKEPRASAATMAALFRALVGSDLQWRNRGFVLDGWPRTANAARCAFMQQERLDEEDQAELAAEEAAKSAAATAGKPTGKGSKAAPPPPKKETKSAKGTPTADTGPVISPGNKLVPDPGLAPTHFIELDASEEILFRRMQGLEAAEQEAHRAAAQAASQEKLPPAPSMRKGLEKVPTGPQSHNNEKDFNRRLDAWNKLKADDQEEMSAKVVAAQQIWEYRRTQAAEAAMQAHAEASTLRAKRKRAKAQEAAAAQAAASLAAREEAEERARQGAAASSKGGGQQKHTHPGGATQPPTVGATTSSSPRDELPQAGATTRASQPSLSPPRSPGQGHAGAPWFSNTHTPPPNSSWAAGADARAGSGRPDQGQGSAPVQGPEWVGSEEDAAAARADAELERIEAAGPKLPRFGGLAGVVVASCGAASLRVHNDTCYYTPPPPPPNPAPPGSYPVRATTPPKPVPMAARAGGGESADGTPPTPHQLPQEVEAQIKAFIGPPHNFEGFPLSEAEAHALTQTPEAREQGLQQLLHQQSVHQQQRRASGSSSDDGSCTAPDAAPEGRKQAAQEEALRAELLKNSHTGRPLRQQLMTEIMPAVSEALSRIAAERPSSPLRILGEHLIKEAQKREVLYVDPYSDPKYDIQANKIRAKAERDAARERAAKEKADKELAMKRQAAKAAAEANMGAGSRGEEEHRA